MKNKENIVHGNGTVPVGIAQAMLIENGRRSANKPSCDHDIRNPEDSVKIEVTAGHGGDPYIVDPTSPIAKAGLRALEKAFKAKPLLLREGGSIPILNDIKKIIGVDTLLLGLALPDDNAHSPNEKFEVESFTKGMQMAAHLWQELKSV